MTTRRPPDPLRCGMPSVVPSPGDVRRAIDAARRWLARVRARR